MKRILFISSNIHTPWGGSEVLWYKTAVSLKRRNRDVDVAVIARKWPSVPAHIREIAESGGLIYDLPMYPATPLEYLKSRFLRSVPARRKALLERISPDLVVHSMGKSFEGGDWMEICRESGVAYVNVIHLASELQWPENSEVECYRKGYRNAAVNYFVSRGNRDMVSRQLGMDMIHSAIIRNPITVSRSIQPYPQTAQGYHMALPAMLVPIHKGHDILFDVLAQEKWKQRPLHLNLYGVGAQEKSLRCYSEYLGLKNVHFRGYSTNLEEVWAQNHLLVMASRMEGLPLTLIEAMCCGRSAVVTGVAGMKEIVKDGETGFVAGAAHSESLDEALERAWQKREQWQEMGQRSFEMIQDLLPYEPEDEFAAVLLGLLSKRA